MKSNEARPFFRILGGLFALAGWFVAIVTLLAGEWNTALGLMLVAVAFSWVAIAGYMPRPLFWLFSHASVIDKDDGETK